VTDIRDPGSPARAPGLAFLELGERLRQRGQLDAAATVALAGLAHYPTLADAHDLLGRIRVEQGQDAVAMAAWRAALECDVSHVGARKGLAYIAFRARDFATAEEHLELAVRAAPHDVTVLAALDRVRAARPVVEPPPIAETGATGFLLFDGQGMRLNGSVGPDAPEHLADAVAAEGASLAREGARVARLLSLGDVQHVVVESSDARVAIFPVAEGASLLVSRPAATPVGRLLALGQRASSAARDWLGRLG
jgi:predicted regulator of Ras-like GTPase activity (Roadblock/LC7/MglB family)